jgi:hypothetical protein
MGDAGKRRPGLRALIAPANNTTTRSPFPVGAMLAAACLLLGACGTGTGPESHGTGGSAATGTGGVTGTGGAMATGTGGVPTGSGGRGSGGITGQGGAPPPGTGGGTGSGGRGSGGSPGGTGGGPSDGGVASPVTPTSSGGRYQFTFGNVVLEIDPMDGGRVSKLALSGTDLIVSTPAKVDGGNDPTTWGSVFWTSPRSDWTPVTWPPPVNIDSAAYTGSIAGAHVVVNGMADTSIGVSMSKDYAADATSGWITIKYTINAVKAIKAAPWEISRVPRGGIVFFPVGTGTLTKGPLTITQSAGVAWFDDAAKSVTSPNGDKCYGDGMGWTAYVLGGNLFLKKFTDQPASAQAPGEGEIDVYPGNGFLEFEVEGPYTQIATGANLPWSIQWKVVKVPSTVTIAVGSTTLVDFAKQQLMQ